MSLQPITSTVLHVHYPTEIQFATMGGLRIHCCDFLFANVPPTVERDWVWVGGLLVWTISINMHICRILWFRSWYHIHSVCQSFPQDPQGLPVTPWHVPGHGPWQVSVEKSITSFPGGFRKTCTPVRLVLLGSPWSLCNLWLWSRHLSIHWPSATWAAIVLHMHTMLH